MAILFQALVGFIATLVGKLFAKFTERLAKNAAATVLLVSAYIALLLGLAATISAILSGINATLPADLANGISMFKPDNLEESLSAYIAAKVAIWIYQSKRKFLEWQSERSY